MAATLNQLDRDVIESVLQMEQGYVLDFSDRTFAEFFADFRVPIDDASFRASGSSKANRLRTFLRTSPPELAGTVLQALLEWRLLKKPAGLISREVEHYRALVRRLTGSSGSEDPKASGSESELLRKVFSPELLKRLPLEAALLTVLAGRMEEAHRCIDARSFLAATILCGSVLEGMCLGFANRSPERTNRGYVACYNKTAAPAFHNWKLREWIDVLASLGDLSPNVRTFGHGLRDFRNYVHPAEQLVHGFSPDEHTARIGFQVVVAAIEDLVRAQTRLASLASTC